jgi:hypothetical protein
VDDQVLRRRLIREHLYELVALVLAVAFMYFLAPSYTSVLESGSITLNAWGRPVTLLLSQSPFAVVGVLLIIAGFVGLVGSLLSTPAYHLVRLCFPARQLPRVPRPNFLRFISRIQIAVISLASIGVLCIGWQYAAIQLN